MLKQVKEKDYARAVQEMEDYAGGSEGVRYYDRKNAQQQEQTKHLINIAALSLIVVIILIYDVFVLYIKLSSEESYMKNKYRFLNVIGMRSGNRKVQLSKDIYYFMIPSILLGGVAGGLYALGMILKSSAAGDHLVHTMSAILLGTVGGYIVIQLLFTAVFNRRVRKRVLD